MIGKLPAPNLRILRVAAFQQDQQGCTLESAGDVARMHALADFFGKLRQNFLGVENTDFVSQNSEIIRLEVGKYVQSGRWLLAKALLQTLKKLAAVKKQRCWIALQRIVNEFGRFL